MLSLYYLGNPLQCDCRLLGLWEWIHYHEPLLLSNANEKDEHLVCSGPEQLSGKSVFALESVNFCSLPIITSLETIKTKHNGLSLHWSVQNNSLVSGFSLDYHLTSDPSPIANRKLINSAERNVDIEDLRSDSWYTLCIQANRKDLRINGQPSGQLFGSGNSLNYGKYSVNNNRKCLQVGPNGYIKK